MNPLRWALNWIMVGAACSSDIINKVYYPFTNSPDYEPIVDPSRLEPLFFADLEARFMTADGEFLYERPRPADAGDTALFQGLCTAMKIMKGRTVNREIEFISRLFIQGALIRGYRDDGTINDTTSNDSATGMLFFFYTALRWGSEEDRTKAGVLIRLWVNSLMAHDYALVDQKGKPTKYGQLENGYKTDPLRITLLLGILAVAMVFDHSLNVEYAALYNRYLPILKYPKLRLLWLDTDYDTHRAAIHLHVLYWITRDEIYADGLRRIVRITEKEQNAWVYTLCSIALKEVDVASVMRMLMTFDFNRRQMGNIEVTNPTAPKVRYWGGKDRCKFALPLFLRGSQDFFWQRNMFSRNEWVGNKTANVYHSGLDFLLCGWLGNRLGLFQ